MFESNDNKPKSADKINPIAQIKHLVDGGENARVTTKVMRGSKGSGNAYLLAEIKGVEVFRLECGNIKDWESIDECNMFVFALMEQISAGLVSYVEENKERAENMKQAEREKRVQIVEGVRLELTNAKSAADVRKILKNSGFHDGLEKIPNNVDTLLDAAGKVFDSYVMGDI